MATNGANGHASNGTYSNKPGSPDSLPVTTIFAEWIASAKTSSLTPSIRAKLSEYLVDMIGVTGAAAHSADSTPPILSAVTAMNPSNGGHCTVMTKGNTYAPHIAALLNATFGHSLDFDDTHAPSTLHAGVTAIWASLAAAEAAQTTDIDRVLLAISVAYEVTCRVGTELGYDAYARGFHNTGTAGVLGAVAAVCVIRGLDAHTVAMALGLAGSRAAGSMQYLDNGSHNKRLHPGFACHDAIVCVTMAEHGVIGASRIIEGKNGFLKAYSPREDKDLNRLVDRLGEKWVFTETSVKPYPACRMTHGAIEMADIIANKRRAKGVSTPADLIKDIKSLEIRLRASNMILVGDRIPNKVHPKAEVDGQFSAYFQVAHAYLYGTQDGVKAYTRLDDKDIYALCDKITCVTDDEDAGLAGMGSRIIVQYEDGSKEDMTTTFPLGEAEHPYKREDLERKYRGGMVPVYGEKKTEEVLKTVDAITRGEGSVQALMKLLA